jgi:hypothetical protein
MIRVTHQEIDQADQILHKVLKLQDLLLQGRDKYKYSKNSIHSISGRYLKKMKAHLPKMR